MAKKSRDKGKRIEREACEILRPIFPDVRRRAMQSRGGGEGADLDGTPGWHVEVGGGKTVSPTAKWEQANADAVAFEEGLPPEFRKDTTPIALTHRDRGTWLVTMSADAFVELVRKAPTMPAGMNVDLDDTIALLRQQQAARCCYGTKDGDGKRCDCKYGRSTTLYLSNEQTGCPEMRAALRVLLALKAGT